MKMREIGCLLNQPSKGRAFLDLLPGQGILQTCKDSKSVRREAKVYLDETPLMLKSEVKKIKRE